MSLSVFLFFAIYLNLLTSLYVIAISVASSSSRLKHPSMQVSLEFLFAILFYHPVGRTTILDKSSSKCKRMNNSYKILYAHISHQKKTKQPEQWYDIIIHFHLVPQSCNSVIYSCSSFQCSDPGSPFPSEQSQVIRERTSEC